MKQSTRLNKPEQYIALVDRILVAACNRTAWSDKVAYSSSLTREHTLELVLSPETGALYAARGREAKQEVLCHDHESGQ